MRRPTAAALPQSPPGIRPAPLPSIPVQSDPMKRIAVTLALLASAGSAEWTNFTGAKAPDFPVKEWFNKGAGKTLSDFRGKAVLLEFWATW